MIPHSRYSVQAKGGRWWWQEIRMNLCCEWVWHYIHNPWIPSFAISISEGLLMYGLLYVQLLLWMCFVSTSLFLSFFDETKRVKREENRSFSIYYSLSSSHWMLGLYRFPVLYIHTTVEEIKLLQKKETTEGKKAKGYLHYEGFILHVVQLCHAIREKEKMPVFFPFFFYSLDGLWWVHWLYMIIYSFIPLHSQQLKPLQLRSNFSPCFAGLYTRTFRFCVQEDRNETISGCEEKVLFYWCVLHGIGGRMAVAEHQTTTHHSPLWCNMQDELSSVLFFFFSNDCVTLASIELNVCPGLTFFIPFHCSAVVLEGNKFIEKFELTLQVSEVAKREKNAWESFFSLRRV